MTFIFEGGVVQIRPGNCEDRDEQAPGPYAFACPSSNAIAPIKPPGP